MKEQWISKLGIRMANEHTAKAPEGLLDDIKAEMNRRAITPMATRKKQIISVWVYRSVAAAVLVCGIFLWYSLQQTSTDPSRTARLQDTSQPNTANTASISSIKHTERYPTSYPDADINGHKFKARQLLASAVAAPTVVPIIPMTDSQATPETNQTIQTETPREEKAERPRQAAGKEVPGSYDNIALSARHIRNAASPRFSISTSYGSSGGFSGSAQGIVLAAANPIGAYEDAFAENNTKDAIIGLGERKTKHHQPVKFGISVRYRLNDKWSLQTGVSYGYLSSEFSYGEEGLKHVKEQKLHYVGIPLALNYHFIQGRKVNVYATAGGETEKLMKGKITDNGNNSGYESTSSTSVKEKQLQFSARGAVGVEYMFGSNISAYIEPGVSYHFNNGSHVENIYKEKPANLSLNIGLRININK